MDATNDQRRTDADLPPKHPQVHEHEDAELSESSPLLSRPRPALARNHSVLDATPHVHQPTAIISLLLLAVILTSCGDQLIESPLTRIFESVICYSWYEERDPSKVLLDRQHVGPGAIGGVMEEYCKVDAVQGQLAELQSYLRFFDGFPSLILAIPFGWAADRYGRKPIVAMILFSFPLKIGWMQLVAWFWQSFDIRVTWLSSLSGLLGGGSPVVAALIFTMLADVVPQAGRAAVFFRLGAVNLVAGLIMPPLAAWLMRYNPWIPNGLGLLLQFVAFFLFLLVPETLNYRASTSHPPSPTPEPADPASPSEPAPASNALTHHLRAARSAVSFLTNDTRIPLLMLPFLVHILIADGATSILRQYASKRYHLTLSTTTLLMTVKAGALSLLLFFILPWLSDFVTRRFKLCTQRKDLYLARFSTALMIAGWLMVGASGNIPLFAVGISVSSFGTGTMMLIRSFMASLTPAHHVARLYTFLGVVDTIGVMIGSPFLALLFEQGMRLGGGWLGLPFYLLALVSLAILGILLIVRMRKGEGEEVSEEDEGDSGSERTR